MGWQSNSWHDATPAMDLRYVYRDYVTQKGKQKSNRKNPTVTNTYHEWREHRTRHSRNRKERIRSLFVWSDVIFSFLGCRIPNFGQLNDCTKQVVVTIKIMRIICFCDSFVQLNLIHFQVRLEPRPWICFDVQFSLVQSHWFFSLIGHPLMFKATLADHGQMSVPYSPPSVGNYTQTPCHDQSYSATGTQITSLGRVMSSCANYLRADVSDGGDLSLHQQEVFERRVFIENWWWVSQGSGRFVWFTMANPGNSLHLNTR